MTQWHTNRNWMWHPPFMMTQWHMNRNWMWHQPFAMTRWHMHGTWMQLKCMLPELTTGPQSTTIAPSTAWWVF